MNVRKYLHGDPADYWNNTDRAATVVAFGSIAIVGPLGMPVLGIAVGWSALALLLYRYYKNEVVSDAA